MHQHPDPYLPPRPPPGTSVSLPGLPGWFEIMALAGLTAFFALLATLLGSMAQFMGIIGTALCGFALLTAVLFRLGYRGDLRRLERLRQGLCGACGYDLSGKTDTPRCSECGAPTTPWV